MKERTFVCAFLCAIGLSSAVADPIDGSAFTAPIHLELSRSGALGFPWSAATPSPPQGAHHLDLARIYAGAERTNDALAEYAKALESENPQTCASALAESKDLLTWRHRLVSWLSERFKLGANFILIAVGVLLVWIFAKLIRLLIQKIRCKGRIPRLEIQPLTYWSSPQSPYTHFREIVCFVREKMNEHFLLARQVNIAQEQTVLPTVFSNTILRELEVPMSIISEKGWPIFAWFIRQINPADVTLDGSLTSDEEAYHVVVRLVKHSETQQTWDRTISKTRLADGLKDLAYSVLIGITNKGRK